MELSLQGSQINLNVRDKPPIPAANGVHYPPASLAPHRQRPVSASHSLHTAGANRFPTQRLTSSASLRPTLTASSFVNDPPHRRRPRPSSADVGGAAASPLRPAAKETNNSQQQTVTSSSNILNLLLAEPIRKTSTTPLPLQRRPSQTSATTTKCAEHIDRSSSVEEDIVSHDDEATDGDDIDDDDDADEMSSPKPAQLPACVSVAPSSSRSAEHFQRLRGSSNASTAKSSAHKKYVTFSKEPEILLPTAVQSKDNCSTTLKPNLPGRVSFSSADVYAGECDDYSDADGEQTPRVDERPSQTAPLRNNIKAPGIDVTSTTKASREEPKECNIAADSSSPSASSCCSLNCKDLSSSHNCDASTKKVDNMPAVVAGPQHDESDHIIAEYKREIAKLNRDHKQSIGKIFADNETTTLQLSSAEPSEKSTDINASAIASMQGNRITIDSSSVVINNYLKTTKQLPELKSTKNATKPNNLTKINNALPPKAPASKPPKRTASAGTTKSQREDARLNEFHLDKVESWMSIHEFADEAANHTGKPTAEPSAPDSASSHRRAAQSTPNSKTTANEDEGMFSFDEQPDGDCSSTYEEIASVLKEIEATKDPEEQRKPDTVLPNDATNGRAESPDKMREILAYLDGVESSCTQQMQDTYAGSALPDSFRSEIEFAVEPDIIGDMPKIDDLIVLPNQQLARRVIALSLRANELNSAIQLSREHMASVRHDKQRTLRAEKHAQSTRLAEQKRHFESVVQRHQTFIEQLLKDKTALADKVAALTRRLDSQEQAWRHKLDTEVARTKETTLAGEKIRRERWVRENTKKIKELTVKGLEHEINQMTGEHQAQITQLRATHQQDLLRAIDEERQRHEQIEADIRGAHAADREGAIERERAAIRERFERQIADEQRAFEQQKARLSEDAAAELRRLQAALHAAEQDHERRRTAAAADRQDVLDAAQAEFAQRLAACDRQHQQEMAALQQQYEADFKIWRREHETAGRLREAERANALRAEAVQERDRQIDAIVARLDAESQRKEQELEQKLSRQHDKHAAELRALDAAECVAREKHAECRARLADAEAARDIAQSTVKQLGTQLQHVQQLYEAQLGERDSMREAARRDVQLELQQLRKERDTEIERIRVRVQQTVERKDASAEVLHKENAALRERCVKLEAVVRQQRQDYFVK